MDMIDFCDLYRAVPVSRELPLLGVLPVVAVAESIHQPGAVWVLAASAAGALGTTVAELCTAAPPALTAYINGRGVVIEQLAVLAVVAAGGGPWATLAASRLTVIHGSALAGLGPDLTTHALYSPPGHADFVTIPQTREAQTR